MGRELATGNEASAGKCTTVATAIQKKPKFFAIIVIFRFFAEIYIYPFGIKPDTHEYNSTAI